MKIPCKVCLFCSLASSSGAVTYPEKVMYIIYSTLGLLNVYFTLEFMILLMFGYTHR